MKHFVMIQLANLADSITVYQMLPHNILGMSVAPV